MISSKKRKLSVGVTKLDEFLARKQIRPNDLDQPLGLPPGGFAIQLSMGCPRRKVRVRVERHFNRRFFDTDRNFQLRTLFFERHGSDPGEFSTPQLREWLAKLGAAKPHSKASRPGLLEALLSHIAVHVQKPQ